MSESLTDLCAHGAGPSNETGNKNMNTGPADSTVRTSATAVAAGRRWAVCFAVVVLALSLAFDAAAQSTATKGLSGPTLRLFKAVELNDISAVKGSLDDGADLAKENDDGMTAADLAVDLGHFIIAHYLLSRRLLGETEPVLLAPLRKPDAATASAAAQAKPTFARPPAKPSPPAPMVAEKPATAAPDSAAAPTTVEPAPAGAMPAEAPPEGPPPAVAEAPAAPGAAAVPAPMDKPLGDIGVTQFFKALVDLITPGGEKPAAVAAAKPGKDQPAAAAKPGEPAAEPPEIVVEITGDAPPPTGEVIKEVKEPPLPKLADKDLETLTAETVTAEPPKEEPKTAAKPMDAGKAKAEKPADSALDRLAGLMKPDAKKAEPAAAATPPPALPAPPGMAEAPAAAKAAPPRPDAAGGTVATYQLTPPPTEPAGLTRFSPRFLDKLADFLETGDEAAFKAWLPEMQIMGSDTRGAPKPASAAAPAGAEPTQAAMPAAKTEMPAAMEKMAPATAAKDAATPAKAVTAVAPEDSPLDALEADLAGIAGEPSTVAVAAAAEGAPAQPAPAAAKPGMFKGAMDKLLGVLTPGGGDRAKPERLVLEPEEKLAAADSAAAAAGRAAPAESSQKVWPVTEVEPAKTQPIASARPISDVLLKTSLRGVTLSIGESVSLENSFPPAQDGIDPQNQCVKKNRGTTLFCLEPVDWPDKVQADFLVPTILYTGHKAIARYDQGIASRFHALFPSDAFERVTGYFRERFGEPTDVWNRSIAPFAKPRQDNPTLAWRSVDPKTGAISVLEIRKYDDSRGGFPDINRGAVMLYLANSPPIFPQVSSHELMRLSRTRMGPPGAEAANAAAEGAPAAPGEPAVTPDLALPGDAGAPPDLALPEPEPAAAGGQPGAAAEPGAEGKTEKQIRDEARAKRRAEREAKRAAGAAKQAAGAAKQEIGTKRAATPATPPAGAAPAAPDTSLDLPPEPMKK